MRTSPFHPSSFILHPFPWWQPLVIVGAGVLVYANSLHGAFVFDDVRAIANNRYITDPLPAWKQIFSMARPVVTWSLAANYGISGREPWSYHVFNILVHIAAGLALYGLVRRTLALVDSRALAGRENLLALVVAVLFVVHPLQTESVDYIIQRAEALMGLFYLLTLYALARAASAGNRRVLWYGTSILACAFGMASKEPMVTAPVVAFLYDRTFLAGSFRQALTARWKYYLGLAATWIVLVVPFQVAFGVLPDVAGGSGAGFYVPISPWKYMISESGVLLHYLGLVFWPSPLCLDYQWPLASGLGSVLLPGLSVAFLLAVTTWCLWRHPIVGFLAASFFIILAPTSSIMPIVDLAFEHRMYLAIAPVLILAVWGVDLLMTWLVPDANLAWVITFGAAMVAACGLGLMTIERNRDYESDVAIWRSTLKARPENIRARFNLAETLIAGAPRQRPEDSERSLAEAQEHFARILELDADHVYSHIDLGQILLGHGQTKEAMQHFHRAIAISPNEYRAHQALGAALLGQKQIDEGIQELQKALQLQPDAFNALFNMAEALWMQGHHREALADLEKAASVRPTDANLLRRLTELTETAWLLATRPDPGHRDGAEAVLIAEALCRMTHQKYIRGLDTLAAAYAEAGRFSDAQTTISRAIRQASSPTDRAQVPAMSARLKLYEKGMPFRDDSLTGSH